MTHEIRTLALSVAGTSACSAGLGATIYYGYVHMIMDGELPAAKLIEIFSMQAGVGALAGLVVGIFFLLNQDKN